MNKLRKNKSKNIKTALTFRLKRHDSHSIETFNESIVPNIGILTI
jgi:hypothetical protein